MLQDVAGNSQYEDPVDEYLDQIDELTHKLSVAEGKLKSLQSGRKSASCLNFYCPCFFDHPQGGIVYNFGPFCMSVCQTITFQRVDI